ncbi:MAG: type II secretion system F family protein [Phycisphaeraceae bacterium JB051]
MAVFAYKATNAQGKRVQGTIVAETPRLARDMLREQGLAIQKVTTRKESGGGGLAAAITRLTARKQQHKVVAFIRELATLLAVGTPLLESMDVIIKQHDGSFGSDLLQIRERIASGNSLAQAMRAHPQLFDAMDISIVEVGENAGTLEIALERLGDFKERWQTLKGRITTALIYPCIVIFIGLVVGIFQMTYVVPNLLNALIEAGHELPWITQVVKAASDLMLEKWWLLLLITFVFIASVRAVIQTNKGRRAWHRMQLKLPVLGELIRKQALVRIAVVMSTLLRSGVVFIRAIQIAQQSTSNVILRDSLHQCEEAIFAGEDIAQSMEKVGAFPPLVVQIFAVGQQSGRLEEMLDRLANDYDKQVQTAANRLTAILEPVLIIVLAAFVFAIAAATVFPILEASNIL